jgi:hypothetical protein
LLPLKPRLNGAGEDRTPDLLTASQAFSQLNYGPLHMIRDRCLFPDLFQTVSLALFRSHNMNDNISEVKYKPVRFDLSLPLRGFYPQLFKPLIHRPGQSPRLRGGSARRYDEIIGYGRELGNIDNTDILSLLAVQETADTFNQIDLFLSYSSSLRSQVSFFSLCRSSNTGALSAPLRLC